MILIKTTLETVAQLNELLYIDLINDLYTNFFEK